MDNIEVYGIGNVLIDILVNVDDKELENLDLPKGVMNLVDDERRNEIIEFVDTKDKTFLCGGDVPNTIIALSNLGINAALNGMIGSGGYGKIYEDELEKHKVVNLIRKHEESPTGSSVIMITPDHERTMNTHLGKSRFFSKEHIDFDVLKTSKYFYFTGYMWDTENQKEAVQAAIDFCEENNIRIVFDVADPFAVDRNREDFLRLIKEHADIVFANKEEAKMLFDTQDSKDAVEKLSELCEIAIVKIGKDGAYVKAEDSFLEIPGNEVHAHDTTGAGDIFAAGFMYGVCKKMSLEECGVFASYLASQIVMQKGGQFSEKKMIEIMSHVDNGTWDFRES